MAAGSVRIAALRGLALTAASVVLISSVLDAQGRGQPAPALAPRAAAPIDATGYWVSLVTDDWRWRMMTPPKGDILYLPVNAEGRRVAEGWDPAKDQAAGEACRAYGAPGVMSLPGRLHVTWDNDTTLKVEIDTGMQTRWLRFGDPPAASPAPDWQGTSRATWEYAAGRARGSAARNGSLKVVTTQMRPGYFRKNGVPYGANAVLTEYFAVVTGAQGEVYLAVTRMLEDPQYLNAPYVRTVQFRKQNDGSGWNPTPCTAS
jgi:hypothetical protein